MTKCTGNLGLIGLALTAFAAGCAEDVPVRTVTEFMEDQIGLEATLSRCNADRRGTRNDPECRNAREANKRMASEREAELQRRFEEESQRKREQIRARNEAAEAARRRAEEAAREREQYLYEQQFNGDGTALPEAEDAPNTLADDTVGDAPGAIAPSAPADEFTPEAASEEAATAADDTTSDLEEVRRELERRNQDTKPPVG
ncbi:MAG: EexN family lipoprotein [Pseudomonadota bacterium]